MLVVAGQPTWLKRGTPGARLIAAANRLPTVLAAPEVADDDFTVGPGLDLPVPDQDAMAKAKDRLLGAGMGSLTEVVAFAAGAQGTETPRPFEAVRVLLVHGAHEGGLAAGDGEALWSRRLAEVAAGGGPLGLLAGQAGASLQLVDTAAAGLATAAPVEAGDAAGAADIDAALRYGWRLAEAAADGGTDLLVLAGGGPGQETAAVAMIAAVTSTEAFAMLPRVRLAGGRFDDPAWMVRCAAVRDALHRARTRRREPKELLAVLGGASRRTPVLVDGPVGIAAGLVARELAIEARPWLLLADHGGHPAAEAGADLLGLTPVAALGLGLGEGAASLAVLPLIQSALLLSTVDTVDA